MLNGGGDEGGVIGEGGGRVIKREAEHADRAAAFTGNPVCQ